MTSIGIVLIALPFIALVVLAQESSVITDSPEYVFLLCVMAASAAFGIASAIWAGKKWYLNQRYMDKRLEASAMRADRLIRDMTEEEKNANIQIEIANDTLAVEREPKPEENLKSEIAEKEETIRRFREMGRSPELPRTFRAIEDGTLKYLKSLYPDLKPHVALPTPQGALTFDAVVQGWDETVIIEIKILRHKMHTAIIDTAFWNLEKSISKLRESLATTGFPIEVKLSGVLVIVADFDYLGRVYKESVSGQLSRLALNREFRISTLFVDIRDIGL